MVNGFLTMMLGASISAASSTSPEQMPITPRSDQQMAQGWVCQPRLTCKQISSCEEAVWYLQNCSWGGRLDRDSDGIPCESLC